MRVLREESGVRTLRVYTTPIVDTTAYEVIRDIIHKAALESPEKEVKGGMALAFAREISGRTQKEADKVEALQEINESDWLAQTGMFNYSTPWSQLVGKGTSTKPPGAFAGINGRFRNTEEVREALGHPQIEEELVALQSRLPQARLIRLKELLRTSLETEIPDILQRTQIQDPVVYKLYDLENEFITSETAKSEFEQTLQDEVSRVKSEVSLELLSLIHQIGNYKLLEDPNELWMTIVKNLHEQELLQPPHQWDVSDGNLDNISWITRRNFETLATIEERPNPFNYSSREANQNEISLRNLIDEVGSLNETNRRQLILSPGEIVALAKSFYDSYKEDGVIKGNPLSYDSEQNRFHLDKVSEIDSQIAQLESQSALAEEDKGTIQRLKQERSHHKAEAKRYEESFLQKIELDSGWDSDGTRIIPGLEGVKFLRAKDYPGQANQEVTDPQELNGRILRREIQALSYHQENHDSGKLISFLTKAKEYLSQQGFSNEQITAFLDVYSQSLEYYGKGLSAVGADGKEQISGGHGQISFAAAQITNLSQGSPIAQEMHRCIESVLNKALTINDAQTALAKLSPQELENLRAEFHERTGIDLVAFEPETAVFGEDGSEYRPRQPHDKKDPVNIVEVEIDNGSETKTEQRNQITIRDVRGSFVEPKKKNAQNETIEEAVDGQTGSNPMHHFFGKTGSAIKEFYDWAIGNPRLSLAAKRQKQAEGAINKVLELTTFTGLSEQQILTIVFKGLVQPNYLSFAEKQFFEQYAIREIYKQMQIKDLRRFKHDQMRVENNVFLGIQNINRDDQKALNTQALVNAVISKFGGTVQFASDLKLTAEHDLEMILDRYKILREGWSKRADRGSSFYTENNDSINYYAGCSDLIDTTAGRLRLILDMENQWADWLKLHSILDHHDRVKTLEQSTQNQSLYNTMKQLQNSEGYLVISEWINQNLLSLNHQSLDDIVQNLPANVRKALDDGKQFGDFLEAQEKYTEALFVSLKGEEYPSYFTDSMKALFERTILNIDSKPDLFVATPTAEERLRSLDMAEENAHYLMEKCQQLSNEILQTPASAKDLELAKRVDILRTLMNCWNNYPEHRSIIFELNRLRIDPETWKRRSGNYTQEKEYTADFACQALASHGINRSKEEINQDQKVMREFLDLMKTYNSKNLLAVLNQSNNRNIVNAFLDNDSFISIIQAARGGFEASLRSIEELRAQPFEEALLIQADTVSMEKQHDLGIEACDRVIVDLSSKGIRDNRLRDALYTRGVILYRKGDYSGAISDHETCLAIDPTYSKAWAEIGMSRKSLKNSSGAEEAYQKALELNSADLVALSSMGELAIEKNELRKAVGFFRRAVEAHPSYYSGYIVQAELKMLLKDHNGARRDLEAAYRINSDSINNRLKEVRANLKKFRELKQPMNFAEKQRHQLLIKEYEQRERLLLGFLQSGSAYGKGFGN